MQVASEDLPGPSRRPSSTPTVTSVMVESQSERPNDVEKQAAPKEGVSNRPDASTPSTDSRGEKDGSEFIVKWDGEDDPGCPLNTPMWRKWMMTIILAVSCQCVTCCSSMAGSTYAGMQPEFGVSREVCVLSISLFVAGLGVGPLFLGPISEFIGRARVMHGAFLAFFLLNFPVAFANNIAVHLVFRFLTGFGGSAFLSVSGGAISDVFPNEKVGTPMMIFSAAPFIGPVLGPLVSGFINQHTYWRWTFYVVIIWAFVMLVLILVFVPETYDPELLRRRAVQKRKETGDDRYKSPRELANKSFSSALSNSLKTPFILLSTQLMVLFLDIWSAIILGILYLSFGGIPYVFRTQYGFDLQQTGLAFLGIGLGQIIAVATQPYFNRKYRETAKANGGLAPPEARLVPGMYGAILAPLGLLLFALTSFSNVPWIIPILSTMFFGMGMVYAYTSTFTYLVDAYRPVAASALASNSFLRSAFAAGFPLFGNQMYEALGAVGGSALLAGLMALCIPMPFVFYRIGGRIREKSPFAAS